MRKTNRSTCLILIISALILQGNALKAQYLSLYGNNVTQILTDNSTFDFEASSFYGGAISYTNYLALGFNYNLGLEYDMAENASLYLLQTGLSNIIKSPSSFSHAKNKESVSMNTNNWLIAYNLNFYNGLAGADSNFNYVFAAEPSYAFAYALGKKKKVFIGGEIAIRYTLFSGDTGINSNITIPLKAGLRYEL